MVTRHLTMGIAASSFVILLFISFTTAAFKRQQTYTPTVCPLVAVLHEVLYLRYVELCLQSMLAINASLLHAVLRVRTIDRMP